MKTFTIAALLSISVLVAAVPPFDPAGAKNVGNGAGTQFIGGQCLSNADCQSACCANPTGICSGPGASTQNGKTGCGFGSAGGAASSALSIVPVGTTAAASSSGTSLASTSPANGGPAFDPAGAKNVGNGAAQQFIGGQCLSGADCQNSGADNAGSASSAAAVSQSTTAASSASNGGPAFDPAGTKNVGNGQGTQFIGGQCLSGADCQSTCCAGPSGICSGLGAQTQAGKTGCGFVSKKKLLRV
ncbi:hypothetical protein EG329_003875 [Mollisiaceae sp. DMI_Dod_QoI]|nr:hypothetical protein EG329_003875 [Helotiales sp. DMI_Dod_QoI]